MINSSGWGRLIMKQDVYMGVPVKSWMSEKTIKYVTFNVTDDCNLACTYCYFVHKNTHKRMTFDIAKKAVDYILSDKDNLRFDGVVWDFIGGEPSLEAELIINICDYILRQMHLLKHKWLFCHKFMMCSNGLLYDSPLVQKIVRRYGNNFQISISIDGNKEKHDLSRKRKDGTGSYDSIMKIVPLWLKQQGVHSTKATFAHDDLPYLKESIVSLWNLGIYNVMANIVFEDVWKDGDDSIFENQLKELADYIIENELWNKCSVRFFAHSLGLPINDELLCSNFCGAGKMLAISTDGEFFPCMRFLETALNNNNPPWSIGSVDSGIDKDRLRAFYALTLVDQSQEKCLNCDVASGCSWCSALNYDCSEDASVFERKTYICKMHHANARANKYFWKRYELATGYASPLTVSNIEKKSFKKNYAYILTNGSLGSFCQFSVSNQLNTKNEIKKSDNLDSIMDFCSKNSIIPIFDNTVNECYTNKGIVLTRCNETCDALFKCKVVYDSDIKELKYNADCDSLIYISNSKEIKHLAENIIKIFNCSPKNSNINLYFENLYSFSQEAITLYISELSKIADFIAKNWQSENFVNLNVLTHIFCDKQSLNCGAGCSIFAIDLEGNIYVCPAFYYDKDMREKGLIGNIKHCNIEDLRKDTIIKKLVLCQNCHATNCVQCVYINKKYTGEYFVPTEIQCIKSNIEYEVSKSLFKALAELGISVKDLPNYSSFLDIKLDPLAANNPKFNINKYNIGDIKKYINQINSSYKNADMEAIRKE